MGNTAAQEEAEERRAEITDLTRRMVLGAVLTLPVLFAVMAHEVFGADWVPAVMHNHWVQASTRRAGRSSAGLTVSRSYLLRLDRWTAAGW